MNRKELLKMTDAEFWQWAAKAREKHYRFKQRALLVMIGVALGVWGYGMWSIWT